MKQTRLLAGILLVLLLLSAASCGVNSNSVKEPDEAGYFKFGNYVFAIDAEVTDAVLEQFGEQTKVPANAPNCAFDGKGMLYTFSGFEVETYAKNGKNYFYGVYLFDDSISADRESITIGSTKDEVLAAYGQADDAKEGSLTYHRKGMDLLFFFREDRVTNIYYLFSVE